MNKRGILVVSFGTTYSDTREKTIEAIERELKEQFSDRTFYRAFTSEIVRSVIWEKEGNSNSYVAIALEQMLRDGIQDILVQPTHVIAGMEYDKMITQIQEKQEWFETIRIGKPLLNETRDYEVAAKAILEETNRNVNWTKHMAVVYMDMEVNTKQINVILFYRRHFGKWDLKHLCVNGRRKSYFG